MRVNDDWKTKNADAQSRDPDSLLQFWKRMLSLRKEYKDLFIYGSYELFETGTRQLFVFTKAGIAQKSLTVVNMSEERRKWSGATSILGSEARLLVGNFAGGDEDVLLPWEGRVYIVDS